MAGVEFLHRRLQVGCPAVLSKALELERRSKILCRSLGKGAVCRSAVCLELACRLRDKPVDRGDLMKRSGAVKKVYQETYTRLRNVLKISTASRVSVQELAVKFGGIGLVGFAEKVLGEYKQRVMRTLPPAQRRRAVFDNPTYVAVAFFLSSAKHNHKLDKHKIMDSINAQQKEFEKVCMSMRDVCHSLIGVTKKKRKRRAEDGEQGSAEDTDSCPASLRAIREEGLDADFSAETIPGYAMSKQVQSRRDYDAWKQRMLCETAKSKVARADSRPRKKQSRLAFAKSPGSSL